MFYFFRANRIKILHATILFFSIGLMPTTVMIKSKDGGVGDKISKDIKFKDLSSDQIITLSTNEFLYGAVAAEMPATFEIEALKAQTVAIYSYLLYKSNNLNNVLSLNSKSGNFGISNFCVYDLESKKRNWGNKFEEYEEKIKSAVDEVVYEFLEYDGKPAYTFFFTSCYKRTNSCESVFGGSFPYLQSVDSNEYDSDFIKNSEAWSRSFSSCKKIKSSVLKEEIRKILGIDRKRFDALELVKNKSYKNWFSDFERSENGTVKSLSVLGNKIKGHKFRMSLQLRSTNFNVNYNKGTDEFEFNTKGFGHGVGMSQCGANAMALCGKNYKEILAHYYPGTLLSKKIVPETDLQKKVSPEVDSSKKISLEAPLEREMVAR